VIANKNAPRQCVVSGPVAAIKRSEPIFAARAMATRPIGGLPGLPQPAGRKRRTSFRLVLEAIDFAPLAHSGLRKHDRFCPIRLTHPQRGRSWPVSLPGRSEFVAQVEAMYRMGARTFLEAGPDSKLCSLVRAILEGQTIGRLPSTNRAVPPATSMTSPARWLRSRRWATPSTSRSGTLYGGQRVPRNLDSP